MVLVDPRAKEFTNRLPVASTAQPSGVAMAGSVAQVVVTVVARPVKATRVTVAGMEGVKPVHIRVRSHRIHAHACGTAVAQ